MALFDRFRAHPTEVARRRAGQPPPAPPSPPVSIWHPDTKIVNLTGQGDWLTLRTCYTGIAAFGQTGSGKTSSLIAIAEALMELQAGFVWMCAKGDEVALVQRLAAATGRSKDLVIIGRDMDGRISPHRFNPLDYELSRPHATTRDVVQYLSDCNQVLSRKEGQRGGDHDGKFWDMQFERLLYYCIETARLAGRPLSVQLLRSIQMSAPTSRAEKASDEWAAQSTCWQCLEEAEARLNRGEIEEEDFNNVFDFWNRDYLRLDEKPRGTIDVMFAALVDSFKAEEPLRSLLTKETTITPDDVIEGGKIAVLSLPTAIYRNPGRMAQFCFKYSFQRAMRRRAASADGSPLRPAVLWADEAHNFAHAYDSEYFAEVRSSCGISIYLEQSIGGYMQALGAHDMKQVDHYLANLSTKFFFQNGSPDTNVFAAEVIGKRMIAKQSDSTGHTNSGGFNVGVNVTKEERYQVLPGQFSQLKNGGPANSLCVEYYVARAGTTFAQTGANWARWYFTQSDLTR